jgi:hypothetical protein
MSHLSSSAGAIFLTGARKNCTAPFFSLCETWKNGGSHFFVQPQKLCPSQNNNDTTIKRHFTMMKSIIALVFCLLAVANSAKKDVADVQEVRSSGVAMLCFRFRQCMATSLTSSSSSSSLFVVSHYYYS